MADALASGASVLRDVGVQVPLRPQRAVLQTERQKVTNSKGVVTCMFWALQLSTSAMDAAAGTSPRFVPISWIRLTGPIVDGPGERAASVRSVKALACRPTTIP
jgi:hypothetical protein